MTFFWISTSGVISSVLVSVYLPFSVSLFDLSVCNAMVSVTVSQFDFLSLSKVLF